MSYGSSGPRMAHAQNPIPEDKLRQFCEISPWRSATKVALYFVTIALLVGAILVLSESMLSVVALQLALGIVFAHGLELQHEALHHNLFKSPRLNRAFGIAFGLPMLVSYTHYQVQHLHHHKYVGTERDKEIFNYSPESLRNVVSLSLRAFNISRVPAFVLTYCGFLQGQYDAVFSSPKKRRRVFGEYTLMVALVAGALWWTATAGGEVFVACWFIPWLVFAEVAHFAIEFPEHLGCDRDNPDVLMNTRSYRANRVFEYIANRNNYHVEHHLYPKISPRHLRRAHVFIKGQSGHVEPSYWRALRDILASRPINEPAVDRAADSTRPIPTAEADHAV